MAHLNIYIDDETASILREGAKKKNVSVSHHINNLIQRAIVLGDETEGLQALLAQPKFLTAFKKLLMFTTENLALTRYTVEKLNEASTNDNDKKAMLQKAKQHAESYVTGMFDE